MSARATACGVTAPCLRVRRSGSTLVVPHGSMHHTSGRPISSQIVGRRTSVSQAGPRSRRATTSGTQRAPAPMLRMQSTWVPQLVESRSAERCQKQCSAAASSQGSTAWRAVWAEQGGAQDAPARVAGILGDTLDRRELILVFSAHKFVAAPVKPVRKHETAQETITSTYSRHASAG